MTRASSSPNVTEFKKKDKSWKSYSALRTSSHASNITKKICIYAELDIYIYILEGNHAQINLLSNLN